MTNSHLLNTNDKQCCMTCTDPLQHISIHLYRKHTHQLSHPHHAPLLLILDTATRCQPMPFRQDTNVQNVIDTSNRDTSVHTAQPDVSIISPTNNASHQSLRLPPQQHTQPRTPPNHQLHNATAAAPLHRCLLVRLSIHLLPRDNAGVSVLSQADEGEGGQSVQVVRQCGGWCVLLSSVWRQGKLVRFQE